MALVSDHPDTPNPVGGNPIPIQQVWDMFMAIETAMLITRSSEGLQGRPMTTIPRPDRGVIFILTEADSSAARDIRANGEVFLSYQGRGNYVALQGLAHVNFEKGLVKDLWTSRAQVFWPDGPEAHDVVSLVIDPGHADVWDGPGIFRGIASILTGATKGWAPEPVRGEVEF